MRKSIMEFQLHFKKIARKMKILIKLYEMMRKFFFYLFNNGF